MGRSEKIPEDAPTQGLSLKEKEAFVLNALPSLAQYTLPFICSVIGLSDKTTGHHCGSGIRCHLNGRRAILTALHVIEEAKKAPSGVAISAGYGRAPFLVGGDVNIDTIADLAVYFVPSDYPCSADAFWSSERIDRSPKKLATDYLFVHGFPGTASYSSNLLGGIVSRSLPYGAMQRIPGPALRDFEFAIEYDPAGMVEATGASKDLVDPHGLSGSPVWRIGVSGRSSNHWKPTDSLLVGVVTKWSPTEKVLIATSTKMLPESWLTAGSLDSLREAPQ